MEKIVNKVAESGLITLDLETYYPREEIAVFDLKDHLFMGMILREKEYRAALQQTDWSSYQNKHVALCCTADAIIPMWAYMLAANYLSPVAARVFSGTKEELIKELFTRNIRAIDTKAFADARVVVKGCGDIQIGEYAYVEITGKLQPVVRSLMYGEPCSTVPVYKSR